MSAGFDPRRDLETIRSLMERARHYRHPPSLAAFVAGAAALGGSYLTWTMGIGSFAPSPARQVQLALLWGSIFLVALVAEIALTFRATRREGTEFWSPLAKDVVHALWPPLVTALALTFALGRSGDWELIAPVWMLCYGVGGIAAGAYARKAVRRLGAAFLVAGLVQLALPLPSWAALGATFGGFHLVYGAYVAVCPSRGS